MNVKLVGDKVTAGAATAAPVPERVIDCGLPVALSAMLIEPVCVPVAVGVKVTLIEQVPAAARVAGLIGQVLVWPYWALAVMLVMVRAAVPQLVRVTDCGALVVFTVWLVKVKPVGDNETAGAGVVPVPDSVMDCGLPAALSVIEIEPVCVPVAVGVKVTLIEQVPAAASVAGLIGQVLVWAY